MRNELHKFESKLLGRIFEYRILIPEGNNLPSLYLLHGFNGDHDTWLQHTSLVPLATKYGVAVILPSCGNRFYQDTNEESMKSFLGSELIAEISGKHPTISNDKKRRYLAGVSMGGFGAALVGFHHKDNFEKIASLSGAFIQHALAIGDPWVLGPADPIALRKVFGDFQTLEGSERDPVGIVKRAGTVPPIYLLCGKQDPLYYPNLRFRQQLLDLNADVTWDEVAGGHSWDVWSQHLEKVIQWIINANNAENIYLDS